MTQQPPLEPSASQPLDALEDVDPVRDRDRAPEPVNTEALPEDGPQDASQDFEYEEVEAEDPDEINDPEVHEVA